MQKSGLLSGATKSCGCLEKENLLLQHAKNKKDLNNKVFGALRVIKEDTSKNKRYTFWLCECICGNIISVKSHNLLSGHTKSCGCINSQLEFLTHKFLSDNKIDFKTQIKFDDLIYTSNLLFDIGIYDKNDLVCLIELQGTQHFQKDIEFGKLQREITDKMKRDYCNEKKIDLYEIAYKDNLTQKLIEILNKYKLIPCQAQ